VLFISGIFSPFLLKVTSLVGGLITICALDTEMKDAAEEGFHVKCQKEE